MVLNVGYLVEIGLCLRYAGFACFLEQAASLAVVGTTGCKYPSGKGGVGGVACLEKMALRLVVLAAPHLDIGSVKVASLVVGIDLHSFLEHVAVLAAPYRIALCEGVEVVARRRVGSLL